MKQKILYKSGEFDSGFLRLYLLTAGIFFLAVVLGTFSAQGADFGFFEYESFYTEGFSLLAVAKGAFSLIRPLFLLLILSLLPFGNVFCCVFIFLYGFSFAYCSVFFAITEAFFKDVSFYDFILSVVVFCPFLFYLTAGYLKEAKKDFSSFGKEKSHSVFICACSFFFCRFCCEAPYLSCIHYFNLGSR